MQSNRISPPMDRRCFMKGAVIVGGAMVFSHLPGPRALGAGTATDAYSLPPLPYPQAALEPHISARTVGIHYGKHHQGYVRKLNKALQGTPYATLPLPAIIKETAGKAELTDIFNNAAQVWNHTFYWHSMKPGAGAPKGKLAEKIQAQFGALENFNKAFATAAAGRFGSGWAWLVEADGGNLQIMTTANADNPLPRGLTPLITLDVWEHAYYLDYQSRRKEYIGAFLEHLVNWDFAEQNLT